MSGKLHNFCDEVLERFLTDRRKKGRTKFWSSCDLLQKGLGKEGCVVAIDQRDTDEVVIQIQLPQSVSEWKRQRLDQRIDRFVADDLKSDPGLTWSINVTHTIRKRFFRGTTTISRTISSTPLP